MIIFSTFTRIWKANKVLYVMRQGFVCRKDIPEQMKMKVYDILIFRSVLSYGCEAWTLSKMEKSKTENKHPELLEESPGKIR